MIFEMHGTNLLPASELLLTMVLVDVGGVSERKGSLGISGVDNEIAFSDRDLSLSSPESMISSPVSCVGSSSIRRIAAAAGAMKGL